MRFTLVKFFLYSSLLLPLFFICGQLLFCLSCLPFHPTFSSDSTCWNEFNHSFQWRNSGVGWSSYFTHGHPLTGRRISGCIRETWKGSREGGETTASQFVSLATSDVNRDLCRGKRQGESQSSPLSVLFQWPIKMYLKSILSSSVIVLWTSFDSSLYPSKYLKVMCSKARGFHLWCRFPYDKRVERYIYIESSWHWQRFILDHPLTLTHS